MKWLKTILYTNWGNNIITISNTDILFLLTKYYNSTKREIINVSSKSVSLRNSVDVDLWNTSAHLNTLNIEKLNIFSIEPKLNVQITVSDFDNIKLIEIGFDDFMDQYMDTLDSDKLWKENSYSLYILRDSNFSDLYEMFKTFSTSKKLIKGNSQKRHFLSPTDFRMSCYMLLLFNLNFNHFEKENDFRIIKKSVYVSINNYNEDEI